MAADDSVVPRIVCAIAIGRRVRELDERPSASTRAAILAAAAREVQRETGRRGDPLPPSPSWPLAAAAAVMLSTLAVMLAIRTQRGDAAVQRA